MRRDVFRPSLDGFRFPNAFGERGTAFGLGSPLLPAFGMSAGMAWVALDRYLARRPVPATTEPPVRTDALHAELVMRQANALAAAPWSLLVEWQCLPERALPGRPSLAAWSRAHWRRTRRSLDAGIPVMLYLVLAHGRHANPSSNKAVLAIGYEIDRSGRCANILVYDPDRPGNDNLRLFFRTGSGPLDARCADTQVRGFFSVPYDREVPASLSLDSLDGVDTYTVDAALALRGTDAADGPVEIIARRRGGAGLLRISRDRRGRSTTDSLPNTPSTAVVQDAGAVTLATAGRIVARAVSGDLLSIRRLPVLGWRTRNVTRSRRIGDAFRIDGSPAVLSGRSGLTVMACGRGKLVRYRCDALGRWKADLVHADKVGRPSFAGKPALIEMDELHVLCRTENGELLHLHERRKLGWTGSVLTTGPGGQTRFTVADDPIVLNDPAGKTLNALARSKDGAVLLFRRTAQHGWSAIDLTASARPGATGLPAAASPLSAVIDEEGTVHVAARDASGGLIHIWCARTGARGGEQVTRMRAIGERGRIDGAPLLAIGPSGALHIFTHQERRPLLFRWTPVGGWSVESVSRERRAPATIGPACEPVLTCVDFTMHIAFADEAGGVHHACASTPVHNRFAALREARASRAARRRVAMERPLLAATSEAAKPLVERTAVVAAAPPVLPLPAGPSMSPPPQAGTEASDAPWPAPAPRPQAETRAADAARPEPVPARPPVREPAVAKVRLLEGVTPVRPPRAPAGPVRIAPAPAPVRLASVVAAPARPLPQPVRNIAAPAPVQRTNPALEGLPLLPVDDHASSKPGVAARTVARAAAPAAARTTRDDEKEMERIMALAEENPLRVIRPE